MGYITLDATESNQKLKNTFFFNQLEEEFSIYYSKLEKFRNKIDKLDFSILEKESQVKNLYNEVFDRYEGNIFFDKFDSDYRDIVIGDDVNELHTEALENTLNWRKLNGRAILKGWAGVYKDYFQYSIFPSTDSFRDVINELESMDKLFDIFEQILAQYDTYTEHLDNLKDLLQKNLKLIDESGL